MRIENGEWRMENGELRMENGELRMENGEWREANQYCTSSSTLTLWNNGNMPSGSPEQITPLPPSRGDISLANVRAESI